ncbi:MAG: MFS transporter [Cyanobacteria bacterium REEB67]|nr:MFS transporter [Cyanobacteria bacterium REEB67]
MHFVVLFAAALLCEIASNIPVGSLPLALVSEGASESQTAIAMGCGMFAALLVSMPIGMLTDRIGKLPVLKAAAFSSVAIMLLMGATHGIIAGCIQMALRSAAICAYMTAQFAYASGMFSKERAVSAVGAMGILGNVAFAAGPAFGVWLWQMGVHREQYLYASALNLTAALMVLTLPAQYDVKPKRKPKIRVFMRVSWLPAIAFIGCSTLQGGVNGALAVLTFQDRGIVNGALIFTASALTTVLFRYPAGRLVERFGARTLAVPTAILQSFGCVLAAQAFSPLAVILAGAFLGMAWSAVVPVGIAILFENSSQSTRGTAMGSYNLAMAGGAALGALLAAIVTAIGMGYAQAEYFCAGAPFIALTYLFIAPRKKKSPIKALQSNTQT